MTTHISNTKLHVSSNAEQQIVHLYDYFQQNSFAQQ